MLTKMISKQTPTDKENGHVNPALTIPLREKYGCDTMHVTPAMARAWLAFNTGNRGLVAKKMQQFKRDTERGEWKFQADTIRFAPGKLLDGQHRLMVIAETGATHRYIVAWGLDPETQVNMDTGRTRTGRDVLGIEGLEGWDGRTASSAIQLIIGYEKGLGLYTSAQALNREVRDFYLEHKARVLASIRVISELPRSRPVISHSRMLALHYVLAEIDSAAASDFVIKLGTGVNLSNTSPIYFLRERLIDDRVKDRRHDGFHLFAMLVNTWNAVRTRRRISSTKFLRVNDDAPFPEIEQ